MIAGLRLQWPQMGIIGAAVFVVSGALAVDAADSATPRDEAYLDRLQGSWVMVGSVGGKPVRYAADGHRVLHRAFLRFHMIDVESPPRYEAEVFIGFDSQARDYVAHWLDGFGAAGARIAATGKRQGDRLVLHFPYADGAFRDTFTWLPASKSWTLLLESQQADGTWATFANYTVNPRGP